MALIGDSIYSYFSRGFRGQPSLQTPVLSEVASSEGTAIDL